MKESSNKTMAESNSSTRFGNGKKSMEVRSTINSEDSESLSIGIDLLSQWMLIDP